MQTDGRPVASDGYDRWKWIALGAMVIDHLAAAGLITDAVLYTAARLVGRIAMPAFTWILIARLRSETGSALGKTGRAGAKLAGWGVAAIPFVWVLDRPWWWANALLELLAMVLAIRGMCWIEQRRSMAGIGWIAVGGALALCGDYGVMWWTIALLVWWGHRWGVGAVPLGAGTGVLMALAQIGWDTASTDTVAALHAGAVALVPLLIVCSEGPPGRRSGTARVWWYGLYPGHLAMLAAIVTVH